MKFKFDNDFEFNLLNIENFYSSPRISNLVKFIKNNKNLKGDYYEFGVYQGFSLLSIAILFKKLKIKKKVYGFDSFSGFPSYHKKDEYFNFKKLYQNKKISPQHYKKILLFSKIKKFLIKNKKINFHPKNISSSLNFSNNSYKNLKLKIKRLGLDNIELIKGNFEKTLPNFFKKNKKNKILAANIDCDLYQSYKVSLSFVWPKLTKKGMIYLDEYYSLKFPGARIASNEFFKEKKIKPIKIKSTKADFERWYIKK